jgi:hypothetical protein
MGRWIAVDQTAAGGPWAAWSKKDPTASDERKGAPGRSAGRAQANDRRPMMLRGAGRGRRKMTREGPIRWIWARKTTERTVKLAEVP